MRMDSLQMLSVSDNRQRLAIRQQLMRQTLELERPFESLAWASLVFPSSSIAQQQSIAQQRNNLLESADARSMSRQAALIGVNVEQFKLGPAYESLVQSKAVNQRSDSSREIIPLGIPSLSNVASKAGLEFQWYQDREINLASIRISGHIIKKILKDLILASSSVLSPPTAELRSTQDPETKMTAVVVVIVAMYPL